MIYKSINKIEKINFVVERIWRTVNKHNMEIGSLPLFYRCHFELEEKVEKNSWKYSKKNFSLEKIL